MADNFDSRGEEIWNILLRRNLNDWEGELGLLLLSCLEEFKITSGEGIVGVEAF